MGGWLATGCAVGALGVSLLGLVVACPVARFRWLLWVPVVLAAFGVGWHLTTDAVVSGVLGLVVLTQCGALWRSRPGHDPAWSSYSREG